MYVCLCHAVTEHQVLQEAADGARTLEELGRRLGVATGCGCCREHAESLLKADARATAGLQLTTETTINAYAV